MSATGQNRLRLLVTTQRKKLAESSREILSLGRVERMLVCLSTQGDRAMNNNHEVEELTPARCVPWNKDKLIESPLRPSHVWSIRTKLQMADRKRDLALFNLAIDSKLRGCDVVALRVDDVAPSGYAMDRATIRQKKTDRPVRFEMTDQTRLAVDDNLRLTGRSDCA